MSCGELVAQGAARDADDGELVRQQPVLLEVEERGQQLALGQVARRAEDGHDDRVGNSLSAVRNLGKILGAYFHLNGCHA